MIEKALDWKLIANRPSEGSYKGYWTSDKVIFETNTRTYEVTVSTAVKGLDVPCTVIVGKKDIYVDFTK